MVIQTAVKLASWSKTLQNGILTAVEFIKDILEILKDILKY